MSIKRSLQGKEAARVFVVLFSIGILVYFAGTSMKRLAPEKETHTPPEDMPITSPGELDMPSQSSAMPGSVSAGAAGVSLKGRVAIDPEDPRRFVRDGEPWYLVGYYPKIGTLTVDQTDYENYYPLLIDTLSSYGINYFRNVFNMGQPYGGAMTVYPRSGPGRAADGGPRVDLNRMNAEYFDYWRSVIEYAETKDVVVQLTIFDSWHNKAEIVHRGRSGEDWGLRYDYYKGGNNINGIDASTPEEWHDPDHPVFDVQKSMIRAVIDELGHLPNLIFEISNENYINEDWELILADYLTAYQHSKGMDPHLVMPRDLPNHDSAGGKENVPAAAREELSENFWLNRPLIADNDGGGHSGPHVRRQKAWAALTSGAHISYFHPDIYRVEDLLSADARLGMEYLGLTRKFLEEFSVDLHGMKPCTALASQGWCYGRPDQAIIVYLPHGGETRLDGIPESYLADWFNPRTGESSPAEAGPVFTAPDGQDWVLYVRESP